MLVEVQDLKVEVVEVVYVFHLQKNSALPCVS